MSVVGKRGKGVETMTEMGGEESKGWSKGRIRCKQGTGQAIGKGKANWDKRCRADQLWGIKNNAIKGLEREVQDTGQEK